MMSLAAIQQVSRDAAVRACRDNRIPFTVEPQDLTGWKERLHRGKPIRLPFAFLGDYLPQGWRYTEREPLFVDISGCGREDEPALTLRGFLEAIEAGKAYAVVEAGPFQAYVREFERHDSSAGNAEDFGGLTSDEEQEFNDEFAEQSEPDVAITLDGSIALLEPRTPRAKIWIGAHVQADAHWFGNALVVEHRYVKQLAKAMKADGLRIG